MRRKRRYWVFVLAALGLVAIIVGFLVFNLNEALVYYRTPTEVVDETPDPNDRFRLGGQVMVGSLVETSDGVEFVVTDGEAAVNVTHTGTPQQLFQEGIGVVLEGAWDGTTFHSDEMIVKHDEQYRTEDGAVYEDGRYRDQETGG